MKTLCRRYAAQLAVAPDAAQRMSFVQSSYCSGEAVGSPTVILIPAGGSTAKDWSQIQPTVSTFARVCSEELAKRSTHGKLRVAEEIGHFIQRDQ
jgi:hypothetical protein